MPTQPKQSYYRTARTISGTHVAHGAFVAVRYSHTIDDVDWFTLTSVAQEADGEFTSVPVNIDYPAHYLTDFCL